MKKICTFGYIWNPDEVDAFVQIWSNKSFAKKNGLLMEEWLTEHRARLYKKCKELKAAKLVSDESQTHNNSYLCQTHHISHKTQATIVINVTLVTNATLKHMSH